MKVFLRRSGVKGSVKIPPSKSITHRALVCAALSRGRSIIHEPLISDDTHATVDVLKKIGVKITETPNDLVVEGGQLQQPKNVLYCGESGTTLRFLSAVCTLINGSCRLEGGASLSKRPVSPLLDALKQLGVKAESRNGNPPVTINSGGKIKSGIVRVRGDISSQFISALLLVAPFSEGLEIEVTTHLESKPYVEMTLDTMKDFGVEVKTSIDYRRFLVDKQEYKPTNLTIEGDWSSASFPLAAGTLTGQVKVENLDLNSRQADVEILKILNRMGAEIELKNNCVIAKQSKINAIRQDLSDSPDLFPVVSVLCSKAKGESTITGIQRLRIKESDRIKAMLDGLTKMGVKASYEKERVVVIGDSPRGALVESYQDHRIAMALAILSIAAEGKTTIDGAECVSKSYPDFWSDLRKLGANIEVLEDE